MRATIRTRLTLIFGGLFLLTSTIVLLIADLLVERAYGRSITIRTQVIANRPTADVPARDHVVPPPPAAAAERVVSDVRGDVLGTQWQITLVSIVIMGVVAFGLCWWLSGRLLRPVHQITGTARRLSLSNLGERINMKGPRDELKELADTFDAMLDRLARAADDQRRFVANASHELRTPLAVQRAAIEIGLADASPERVAAMRTELLRSTERSQRLIDGLLALAQGERGPSARTPVDLAAAVRRAAEHHDTPGIEIGLDLHPVTVAGDEALLTRLVDNLVQNAVRHNHPGGRVAVRLAPHTGLVVSNTGPAVDPGRVDELFQPFRRLHPDRTGSAEGAGLGLSIVAAIAAAHEAVITATANPGGGLTVRVSLPSHPG